jgi:hypothetical protein
METAARKVPKPKNFGIFQMAVVIHCCEAIGVVFFLILEGRFWGFGSGKPEGVGKHYVQ